MQKNVKDPYNSKVTVFFYNIHGVLIGSNFRQLYFGDTVLQSVKQFRCNELLITTCFRMRLAQVKVYDVMRVSHRQSVSKTTPVISL